MSTDSGEKPITTTTQNFETKKESNKWHRNFTRVMPYYYVNHKAKFIKDGNEEEEVLVRVRKVQKSKKELLIEIAEKDKDPKKKKQKIVNKQTLRIPWQELVEIDLNKLSTSKWTLNFIK